MSEELTTSSTKSQDATQTGSITLPDFNLSLHPHIHIIAPPELQAALKPDESDFEFKGVLVPRPDWIRIPGYRDLRYYEDGGKLIIKYAGNGPIETTWKEAMEFSEMDVDEYRKARDDLLKNQKLIENKKSATAVNCFVSSIQKGNVSPPEGIRPQEKPPKKRSKKEGKLTWVNIPKHPHLRYREENGKLILNCTGSIVETSWMQVEDISKLDQKYWPQQIEKILGTRQSSNRRAAIRLFLKLVEKGEVSRVTFPQFRSDESTGVSA